MNTILRRPALVRARTRDVAYLSRMPAGVPGAVNRGFVCTIEPNLVDPSAPPTSYGVPVALDSTTGGVRPITTGDVAASLYGLLVRPFPLNAQTASGFFGSVALTDPSVPPVSGPCDVLKSGYMTVKLNGAVAALPGGILYIRTAAAAAGKPIGGIEAAADGGNTIAVPTPGSYFRGAADAQGNVEVAWMIA